MGNCYGERALSTVPIIYVEADGTEREVQAEIGNNLLQIAHDNDIELEGKSLWKSSGSKLEMKIFFYLTLR